MVRKLQGIGRAHCVGLVWVRPASFPMSKGESDTKTDTERRESRRQLAKDLPQLLLHRYVLLLLRSIAATTSITTTTTTTPSFTTTTKGPKGFADSNSLLSNPSGKPPMPMPRADFMHVLDWKMMNQLLVWCRFREYIGLGTQLRLPTSANQNRTSQTLNP